MNAMKQGIRFIAALIVACFAATVSASAQSASAWEVLTQPGTHDRCRPPLASHCCLLPGPRQHLAPPILGKAKTSCLHRSPLRLVAHLREPSENSG